MFDGTYRWNTPLQWRSHSHSNKQETKLINIQCARDWHERRDDLKLSPAIIQSLPFIVLELLIKHYLYIYIYIYIVFVHDRSIILDAISSILFWLITYNRLCSLPFLIPEMIKDDLNIGRRGKHQLHVSRTLTSCIQIKCER